MEGGRGAPAQKRVLPKGESGSPRPSPVSRQAAAGATSPVAPAAILIQFVAPDGFNFFLSITLIVGVVVGEAIHVDWKRP